MAAPKKVKWALEADYLQACSCDYGCPCEFEATPTQGFCEGSGAYRIRKGHYGRTKLDGLGFGFIVRTPGRMHEGNGTTALFIDERANPAQREALLQIVSGDAGGMPFEIFKAITTKAHSPKFVPIEFKLKGKRGSARVGDALKIELEPIRNPVTGEEESVKILHKTGFIFKSAECVSNKEFTAASGDLNFSWPDKAGFVSRVKYAN